MSFHETLSAWSGWLWPLMTNHLWQATLFTALALLAASFLKRSPAQARYCVLLLAAVKFALPPVLLLFIAHRLGIDTAAVFHTTLLPASDAPVLSAVITQVSAPLQPLEEMVSAGGMPAPGHQEFYCALTILWLFGLLATTGLWFRRRREFARALKDGRELAEGREADALKRVCARLSRNRRVPLVVSAHITEPGVCGVWRPVIALPEGITAHLSDAELETVFLHELVHVRRWDNLASNLQMLLCCAFWFHPLVWWLDRRLLAERERACDESVVEFTGSSKIYASGILKVCRFCVGAKVAGISGTAGANIRERIEQIMSPPRSTRLTVRQQVLVSLTAVLLIIFSVAGGLLSREVVKASGAANASTGEMADGATDARGEKSPAPDGNTFSPQEMAELQTSIERAPEISIRFMNRDDAPLVITVAKVKIVPLEKGGTRNNEELITPPSLTLVNQTGRRITFLRVSLRAGFHDIVGFPVRIEPQASYDLRPDWRQWWNTVKAGSARSAVTEVIGVQFEDGSRWGAFDELERHTLPAAPAAAQSTTAVVVNEDVKDYIPARFQNPAGAPLVISSALTKPLSAVESNGLSSLANDVTNQHTHLPVVVLTNNSSQRITGIKLRFKSDSIAHAVTAFSADLAPRSSFVYRSDTIIPGSAEQMHVQIIGVELADGSIWGVMDSTISSYDLWVTIPEYISKPPTSNRGTNRNGLSQPVTPAPAPKSKNNL